MSKKSGGAGTQGSGMNVARGGLVVVSGLPGTGKSSIAKPLARRLGAPYLRIDTIEQGLVDSDELPASPVAAGYIVASRLVDDQLGLGLDAVVECVNPLTNTRDGWHAIAEGRGTWLLEVELICSDVAEHRRRVENREVDVPGLVLPDWQQVIDREYEPWERDHLILDTAALSVAESVDLITEEIDELRSRS